jgi:hypothetical protein
MKLTENQINELFKFTREHYVYFYDVQSELVDHLANDIEEIWVVQPHLSFDDARDKSFKKFGIFGFMDVIEAKQKAMNKRYRKILWRFFSEWFSFPKLVITTSSFLILFFMLRIPYSEFVILCSLFILVTFDFIKNRKERKKHKKVAQKKEKIFLLESMIGSTKQGFSGFIFIHLFNSINLLKVPFSTLEDYWLLLISFTVTLLAILFYVSGYVIPQKAEELLQETYPEYKMVNNL